MKTFHVTFDAFHSSPAEWLQFTGFFQDKPIMVKASSIIAIEQTRNSVMDIYTTVYSTNAAYDVKESYAEVLEALHLVPKE